MDWACCRCNLSVALTMRPHLFLYLECEEGEHHDARAPYYRLSPALWQRGMLSFLWGPSGHLFQCFQCLPRDSFLTFEAGCQVTQTYKEFLLERKHTVEINTSSYSKQQLRLGNSRPVISSQAGGTAQTHGCAHPKASFAVCVWR